MQKTRSIKPQKKLSQMCQNGKSGKNGKKPGNSLDQLLNALQQNDTEAAKLKPANGNMGNEGKMSQEQMAEMQKLAGEQQTMQKNLQQLNEEF